MGRRKPVPKKVRRKQGFKGTAKYQKFKIKKFIKEAREIARRYSEK